MKRLSDEQLVTAHVMFLRAEGRRPNTISGRTCTVRAFRHSLRDATLRTATSEDVYRFLATRGWSAGTRRIRHAHLRAFYGWMVLEEHVRRDPTIRMMAPRTPRYQPRPISDESLRLALDVSADPRVRLALMLSAYCGLRASEIVATHGRHLSGSTLHVPDGKGGISAPVAVPAHLAAHLRTLPSNEYWFPNRYGDAPMTANGLQRLVRHHMRSLDLPERLHSCRHWHATTLLQHTGNLRVVQEAMRHSSPQTTAVYTKVSMTERAQAVALLPDLTRPECAA